RNLVDHAAVLAALNPGGLLRQVAAIELLLSLGAAHAPAGAVGARAERVGASLAAHDIALGAHAAGNDAKLAGARRDRALARDVELFAEVRLVRDVVVVAVDRLAGDAKRRQPRRERRQDQLHHAAAV